MVCFADRAKAMLVGVCHITALRYPLQILKAIIALVPILMVRDKARWAWPHEGFKDEVMDRGASRPTKAVECDTRVAAPLQRAQNLVRLPPDSRSDILYATSITDFVEPLKTPYGTPILIHICSIPRLAGV
ncbi:hypothetical protein LCGC14_0511200 [marine sediment metagenome]|uniref:Uncharacterized protein n=1 Tax=marine sediment metagenome TaxID=412755 RepID=A0A0F9S5Z6_9ZZZZ